MKNQRTDPLETIKLASELAGILIETTVAVAKKLAGFEGDDVIKALLNALTARAAAMEFELVALRQELIEAQHETEPKQSEFTPEFGDVRVAKDAGISDVEQARCETDEAKAAEGSEEAEVDEQAGMPIEQGQSPPLAAEGGKGWFVDIWRQEVEAAIFPNATDEIVFTRALSDMAGQDKTLRVDAAKALGGIRHTLSVKVLAGQMQHEQSVQVRQECVKALATFQMKEAVSAVERALADKAGSVRLAAVWGLYHLTGAKSVPALVPMFSDEDKEVRRRAATCIGWLAREQAAFGTIENLRCRQVISALVRCLKDPEKSMRIAVIGALEAITGKKMSEQLSTEEASHQDIVARWEKWWRQELLA